MFEFISPLKGNISLEILISPLIVDRKKTIISNIYRIFWMSYQKKFLKLNKKPSEMVIRNENYMYSLKQTNEYIAVVGNKIKLPKLDLV